MFKPLLVHPQVAIQFELNKLDINDIQGLNPKVERLIKEKVKDKLDKNKDHAYKELNTYLGHFRKLYDNLRKLANFISDSVCLYLKLFSVTDANQQRLVRARMSSIFKPSLRWELNQGIFGGDSLVLENLENTNE